MIKIFQSLGQRLLMTNAHTQLAVSHNEPTTASLWLKHSVALWSITKSKTAELSYGQPCWVLLLALALSMAAANALAARGAALVIGNGAYQTSPALPNPPNDAEAMADKLSDLGFDVVSGVDLDRNQMWETIRQFARKLEAHDVAVIFYAGHGIQVDGRNFILPIDAELASRTDLPFDAISLDDVMELTTANNRQTVVILDACRNNPLSRGIVPSFGGGNRGQSMEIGLARESAASGAFIAYATSPNDVALDGDGRHSPFTSALLNHLPTPGIEIHQLMTRVRAEVYQSTNNAQLPWANSALLGEFYFNQGSIEATVSSLPPDVLAWQSVENSSNASDFSHFLNAHPNSQFVTEARKRLEATSNNDIGISPSERSLAAAEPIEIPLEGSNYRLRKAWLPYPGQASGLAPSADGGWIVSGTDEGAATGRTVPWLVKLNIQGKVIWQRQLELPADGWFSSLTQLTSGDYLAVGTRTKSIGGANMIWLVGFDAHGQLQWQRTLNGFGWAHRVSAMADGALVSGYWQDRPGDPTTGALWHVDALGRTEKQFELGTEYGTEIRAALQLNGAQSGYVLAGLERDDEGKSQAKVWRIDLAGQIIWQHQTPGTETAYVVDIFEQSDSIVVLANTEEASFLEKLGMSSGASQARSRILRSDQQKNTVSAAVRSANGALIVLGEQSDGRGSPARIWFSGTDRTGDHVALPRIEVNKSDQVSAAQHWRNGLVLTANSGKPLFGLQVENRPWLGFISRIP